MTNTPSYYLKVSDIGRELLPLCGVPCSLLELSCEDMINAMEDTSYYNFWFLTALKYLYRAGSKTEDPTEDLKKALNCIEHKAKRPRHIVIDHIKAKLAELDAVPNC